MGSESPATSGHSLLGDGLHRRRGHFRLNNRQSGFESAQVIVNDELGRRKIKRSIGEHRRRVLEPEHIVPTGVTLEAHKVMADAHLLSDDRLLAILVRGSGMPKFSVLAVSFSVEDVSKSFATRSNVRSE